ncbi:hypothetical protein KAH81_08815, partial [bacterium]|nr:hypothetical protein [bacterium]
MSKSLFFSLIVLFAVSAVFAVPLTTNYQAKVTDTTGAPISGTRDITFRIYESDIGGTEVWSEMHAGVDLVDGFFAVRLGETNPLDMAYSDDYYLEIQVDGDILTPREPFSSVLYAIWAQSTDQIGGIDMTEWALFADSLRAYYEARGYDYPFDTLLAWMEIQDSMRTILWGGCPTEEFLYEWMLVFNEFCDRGMGYDEVVNYLDYFDAAATLFDSLGTEFDFSLDDIYNTVMLWSVFYEALDTFFTRTGWDADSIFIYLDGALDTYDTLTAWWTSSGWTVDTLFMYLEMFDSLSSFDVDSIINNYLATFDYDSFIGYWIDDLGYGELFDSL